MRLLYIGNYLKKKNFNPTSVEFLGSKLAQDFQIDRISKFQNILLRLIHIWLVLLLKGKKYDMVLIDTYSTMAFHFAWTAGKLCHWLNVPYIPILHGGNLPERLTKSRDLFINFLSHAAEVVSPSEYLKQKLSLPSTIEIKVIPNLLEIEYYPYKLREKIESPSLIWLRAFDQIYNPEMAIHVVDLLIKSGFSDASMMMIGADKDGSLVKCKNLVKRLNLENHITFTGRLDRAQWIPIAQRANIFINTTTIDNLPVSLLEAMALGIPIVSTEVGGIPYLIESGSTGMLVSSDDATSMTNAIMTLVRDPQLYASISLHAREKAWSYAWENVRLQWMMLLDK